MIESTVSKSNRRNANAGAKGARSLLGSIGFALLLGITPTMFATAVHAQESAQNVQIASVNINAADAETLAQGLKGVGLSRAEEIIRYRETFGPFDSVDELMEVKGVGSSTLEKNRARITLE